MEALHAYSWAIGLFCLFWSAVILACVLVELSEGKKKDDEGKGKE
ncbi:hypothetical protein [Ammonifex degensii]|nr:hypothetical protein [Ammonifex degensii]